ncbi:hypothetical protein FIV34_00480 [Luteibacter pinisoli]|uniref:Uncharacterized protein n=1 Tax=Luteibacter pinisoli TaxID=2589080 RepID=A0A4Y5YZL8_9GAMM|nr:hypothetical protein [Luteibacter pinisoli]QDE37778.1 hypothetical protein FIV34_00480 [Luteibacter pinisoli]
MTPPPLPGTRPGMPAAVRYAGIAVIALVVASLAYGIYDSAGRARVERTEMHDAIAQVKDAALGTHDARPMDGAPQSPVAQVLLKTKGLILALSKKMDAHEAAINALHLDDVLAPATLANQQKVRDGKLRIVRFADENRGIMTDYQAYLQDARALLGASQGNREGMLREFDAAAAPQTATLKKALLLNIEFADIVEKVLTLADTKHDKFHLKDGHLQIAGPTWDEYDALLTRMHVLLPKLEAAASSLEQLQGDITRKLNDAEQAAR